MSCCSCNKVCSGCLSQRMRVLLEDNLIVVECPSCSVVLTSKELPANYTQPSNLASGRPARRAPSYPLVLDSPLRKSREWEGSQRREGASQPEREQRRPRGEQSVVCSCGDRDLRWLQLQVEQWSRSVARVAALVRLVGGWACSLLPALYLVLAGTVFVGCVSGFGWGYSHRLSFDTSLYPLLYPLLLAFLLLETPKSAWVLDFLAVGALLLATGRDFGDCHSLERFIAMAVHKFTVPLAALVLLLAELLPLLMRGLRLSVGVQGRLAQRQLIGSGSGVRAQLQGLAGVAGVEGTGGGGRSALELPQQRRAKCLRQSESGAFYSTPSRVASTAPLTAPSTSTWRWAEGEAEGEDSDVDKQDATKLMDMGLVLDLAELSEEALPATPLVI
jgi:hypothetical protein